MRSMMLQTLLENERWLVVGDLTYMLGCYLFKLCGGLLRGRSSERFAIECDTCGEQMVS